MRERLLNDYTESKLFNDMDIERVVRFLRWIMFCDLGILRNISTTYHTWISELNLMTTGSNC